MQRIFLVLATIANITVLAALVLGLQVGDPMASNGMDREVNSRINIHMLTGLAALTSVTMVYALLFTYFMGTGRWIEETSNAYGLDKSFHDRNQKLKYGMLPGILTGFCMALTTGALGAVADPASPASLKPWLGLSDSTLHFSIAIATWLINLLVNLMQYVSIVRNSRIVEAVLAEVRRIRVERGLPVD